MLNGVGHLFIKALNDLISLLPKLTAVVFVGKNALRAKPLLQALRPGLRFLTCAHPSPRVKASNPALWNAIPAVWAFAAHIDKYVVEVVVQDRWLFVGPFAGSDKLNDWLKKNEDCDVKFTIWLTEPSDDLDKAAAMLGMPGLP